MSASVALDFLCPSTNLLTDTDLNLTTIVVVSLRLARAVREEIVVQVMRSATSIVSAVSRFQVSF